MVGIRAKDHDDKRRLILDHAAELFAKQGFHKTSIAEIARACNVTSKAWIYHYFPNKEAVLFTLIRDFIVYVTDRVRLAIDSDDDGALQLRSFIRECLSIYDEYRINYPHLFSEMTSLPADQQKQIRLLEREYAKLLLGILMKINPGIDHKKHRAMAMTMIAFAAINGTYTWFDSKGALRLDQVADMIAQLLVDGIGSKNAAPTRQKPSVAVI